MRAALILVFFAVLAAGTLAGLQAPPGEPGVAGTAEVVTSEPVANADAQATAPPPPAEAGPGEARDLARAPSRGPVLEPGARSFRPAEAAPEPLRVTRDEVGLFADLVLEAAGNRGPLAAGGPVLAAAPAAIPTPVELVSGLNAPVFATAIPDDERVFVVEQAGRIRILLPDGSVATDPFLDIVSKVNSAGNEQGLLGLAFPPDHATSRAFYVYYTAGNGAGRSVVARYQVFAANPNAADPSTEQIVLEVTQTAGNHNGGTIAFRPGEPDYLWVGLGDGGGGFDPNDNAQDPTSLLGKMLRIDVSGGIAGYAIPADNPFVNDNAVENEIWALGLRNPYRFSFDAVTGDLWIGDVGQNAFEEIDFEPPGNGGRNYQWDQYEGNDFLPGGAPITKGTSTFPELDYGQANGACDGSGGGGSVTGGIIYRGLEPALQGFYFFADFCQNKVWSYDQPAQDLTEQTLAFGQASDGVVAFGEDGFGAMLVVLRDGRIFRVGATGDECDNNDVDDDGDGVADWQGGAGDPGCSAIDDPSERDPSSICDDGIDNDGDGDIDFAEDPSCQSPDDIGELSANDECANGIDDDGDGEIDAPDDPGCVDANDPSELDPNTECDDGVDNDGDGEIDFGNDPQCGTPADDNESPSAGESNGDGGGCGLGFELVLVLPLLRWARSRIRGRAQS